MSRKKFSELLGVHRNTVERYENEERAPDADYLKKVSNLFSVDLIWLLEGTGSPFPENIQIDKHDARSTILQTYAVCELMFSKDEMKVIKGLRLLSNEAAIEVMGFLLNKIKGIQDLDEYSLSVKGEIDNIIVSGNLERKADFERQLWEFDKIENEIGDMEEKLLKLKTKKKRNI